MIAIIAKTAVMAIVTILHHIEREGHRERWKRQRGEFEGRDKRETKAGSEWRDSRVRFGGERHRKKDGGKETEKRQGRDRRLSITGRKRRDEEEGRNKG
jgi:hypothetical protein